MVVADVMPASDDAAAAAAAAAEWASACHVTEQTFTLPDEQSAT
jgi:hypothetical protein